MEWKGEEVKKEGEKARGQGWREGEKGWREGKETHTESKSSSQGRHKKALTSLPGPGMHCTVQVRDCTLLALWGMKMER